MVTQELIAYVKGSLAKGKSKDTITRELLAGGGWHANDIDEVFGFAMNPAAATPIIYERKKQKGGWLILTIIILAILYGIFGKNIIALFKPTPKPEEVLGGTKQNNRNIPGQSIVPPSRN